MAFQADHKGLAPPFRHDRRPRGPARLAELAEVGEFPDVMHFHVPGALADLAPVREEPGNQLLRTGCPAWLAVLDNGLLLLPERYSAVSRDQRLPAFAFDDRLEALARTVRSVDFRFMLCRHLRYGRAVLSREGLQHRRLHDPAQPVQTVDVIGQQVVLDYSPVLRSVDGDDGIIVHVHHPGPARGFPALRIGCALGLDHVSGHPEPDGRIARPLAPGYRLVILLNGDLVAEEPCRAGTRVGNQRLFLGQVQLEFVAQELPEPPLDFLGFRFRPGETEQVVISITAISQPPVARIMNILARHAAQALAQ